MSQEDTQHLRLLAIFHYIVGGIVALFACFPIIHVLMGLWMLVAPGSWDSGNQPPPAFMGWMFIGIGSMVMLTGWTFAVCVLAAGRCLARRRRYLYCLVIAALLCMFMPFGTVLGIFTIIVLSRESVKQEFALQAGA